MGPVGVVDTEMITGMEGVEVGGEALINRSTSKGGEEEEGEGVRHLLLGEEEDVVVTIIAAWMTLELKCNKAIPQESRTKTSHHYQRHTNGNRPRVRG